MMELPKGKFAPLTEKEKAERAKLPRIPAPEERKSKCCFVPMVATVDMRDETTYFICPKCDKQDGQHIKNHKPDPKHEREIKEHYEKLHPGRKRVGRD